MDTFFDQIVRFSDLGEVINTSQALVCLTLSFILSWITAKVYRITYAGPSYSPAFMVTLVMCGMVVGAVMLIIGSNIARAFSLVGALSVVRFRNAVKDPRDVAFIFLVMAIGMACGTGFYALAILLTASICAVVLALHFMGFGSSGGSERVLTLQAPATEGFENMFAPVLREFTNSYALLSVGRSRMGTELELVYTVNVKPSFQAEKLLEALAKVNGNLKVQIAGSSHTFDL